MKIFVIILIVIAAGAGSFVFLKSSPAQPTPNPMVNPSPSPTPTSASVATSTPVPTPIPTIPQGTKADDAGATATGVNNVVNSNNQFSLDIYSELSKQEEGNIFFSPYSISTAIAMVYEGARDNTAEEIQKTFYFPIDNSVRRSSFAAIYNQLNAKNAEHKLNVANALWVQKDYKLLNDYVDILKRYYVGNATNLDFIGATEMARNTINSWVENQTNDKIKDLFPEGSLNPLTRLVLTNAIYFKGQWAREFDKELTKDEDFRVNSANTVQVPMMRQTDKEAKFNYTETDDVQLIELPYKGEKLSMLILLPKDSNGITSLENSLSLQKINEWKNQLQEQRVNLFMPKFTFDSKYTLNQTLAKLGMPTAFTGAADFSGIDGTKNLSIQTVIHQAFIDINEEGTEAAAATGIGIGTTSVPPPPPVFRADHPFIFIIQDSDNGNILFLGKVMNPKD